MNWLRKLLFPFVPLYYIGALINKKMYDWSIKKSKWYDFPLITVGNLSVGGTGKSPMVAYLISLLENTKKVATLSRGYKRKTKGFQLVNENSTALEVGDEPLQFKLNFPKATIAVDADRRNGIEVLRKLKEQPEVIILDDAFQHRKVKAGLQILLTAYSNLYVNDCMLPTGDLREPKSGAKRATIIIVTKCPKEISLAERNKIEKQLRLETFQSVFFSYIDYGIEVKNEANVVAFEDFLTEEFTLLTGIANPKPLVDYLTENGAKFNHLSFSDHHNFTDSEIDNLSKETKILTTEKDFMRLKSFSSLKEKMYYLPITISFIEGQKRFEKLILEYCK